MIEYIYLNYKFRLVYFVTYLIFQITNIKNLNTFNVVLRDNNLKTASLDNFNSFIVSCLTNKTGFNIKIYEQGNILYTQFYYNNNNNNNNKNVVLFENILLNKIENNNININTDKEFIGIKNCQDEINKQEFEEYIVFNSDAEYVELIFDKKCTYFLEPNFIRNLSNLKYIKTNNINKFCNYFISDDYFEKCFLNYEIIELTYFINYNELNNYYFPKLKVFKMLWSNNDNNNNNIKSYVEDFFAKKKINFQWI